MKNLFLCGLFLLFIAGCTSLVQDESLPNQYDLEKPTPEFEVFDLEKEMRIYEQQNRERLANASHLKKGCDSNIKVPSDYPTIQEAVDNVCVGGSVMVSSGTYFERVFVGKPGIKIKAVGAVQLMGGFILNDEADETTIQNFEINLYSDSHGIFSYNADNLSISQNVINDYPLVGNYGIILGNTSGSSIHKNSIDGASNGIALMNDGTLGVSQNNTVLNNTVKRYVVSGISLSGNLDENSIKNNSVSLHAFYRVRPYGGGIALNGNCDYNEIKNNDISDGTIGILITDFNSGNEISGNLISYQYMYGINSLALEEGSDPNIFKNNTVLNSSSCDIVDESGRNIYINNTADCTSGI